MEPSLAPRNSSQSSPRLEAIDRAPRNVLKPPAPSTSACSYVTPLTRKEFYSKQLQDSSNRHDGIVYFVDTGTLDTGLHLRSHNSERSGTPDVPNGVNELALSRIEAKSSLGGINAIDKQHIDNMTDSFPFAHREIQSRTLCRSPISSKSRLRAMATVESSRVKSELLPLPKETVVVERDTPGGGVITQFLLDAAFLVSAIVFTVFVVLFSLVFAVVAVVSPCSRTDINLTKVTQVSGNASSSKQCKIEPQKVLETIKKLNSNDSRPSSFNCSDLRLFCKEGLDKSFQKRTSTPTTDVITVSARESENSSGKSFSQDQSRQIFQGKCDPSTVCKIRRLSKEEMEVLLEEFDTDKNGKLTQDELDVAIRKFTSAKRTMIGEISDSAYRIICKYDRDENDVIDFDEMAILASDIERASNLKLSQSEVNFLITKLDTDKNGKLSDDELIDGILKFKMNSEKTEDYEEFRRILEKIGVNESNTISLNELKVIAEEVSCLKIPLWISVSTTLQSICLIEHTFSTDGWINFYWQDSDLPSKQTVEKGFKIIDNGVNIPIDVANVFQNSVKYKILNGPVYNYDKKLHVVSMSIKFSATFSEFLELEQFPFDRQYLTMRICVRTKEFYLLSKPPDYVPYKLKLRTMASYYESSSVVGYNFHSPVIGTCTPPNQYDDTRITVSFRVERQPNYYVNNVVLPIFMIVSLTPVTFAIAPDLIAERMGIILSLLLTMITFKFVISEQIPKVSTMTLLDKYIVLCYCLFLAAAMQTLVLNLCIDPAFWQSVNLITGVSFEVNWISLHLWMVNLIIKDSFYIPWEEMKDEDALNQKLLSVQQEHIHPPPKNY